ncbi:MAG: hypothetical protein HOM78_01920 [Candidatus Marinimicrobia bacterium]|jgi:hypothetical protein|nr:hypothetical protein [Candidatus Neomarinimicrobiota bacterium]MBT4956527.1 hypothetical protein [Candidatus Neomarinimicrobiota bacterium]MBT5460424.1 hypothetical protein [Candidatus Neomarinimicrobiota bacterium]MBT6861986.1 hypothetical protein [Candidatus Neomarinimicrobiota bacterium]MBT7115406.1 hypothetical protein [Candidatus Neomarinimicrobiota bacterium]
MVETNPDLIGDWFLTSETTNGSQIIPIPQLQWTFHTEDSLTEKSCSIAICTSRIYEWNATQDSLTLTLQGIQQWTREYHLDENWIKIYFSKSHFREFVRLELD